jgi:isopentenyl phosphate kinase
MIFLKLGGSLITDKTRDNTPRMEVIERIAREISAQHAAHPQPLLIGHGSGSFGHTVGRKYGTRAGVTSAEGWRGFAEVSVVAARLNRLIADALHDAGLPVISVPPSASAQCADGQLTALDTRLMEAALAHDLVPLVMGDVALDSVRGGTIVSTEEVFFYLAARIPVTRILLAGETAGVYRSLHDHTVIPRITPETWVQVQSGVGISRGADVTGGMASKVRDMLALVARQPTVSISIFSGMQEGNIARALNGEQLGTLVGAH